MFGVGVCPLLAGGKLVEAFVDLVGARDVAKTTKGVSATWIGLAVFNTSVEIAVAAGGKFGTRIVAEADVWVVGWGSWRWRDRPAA